MLMDKIKKVEGKGINVNITGKLFAVLRDESGKIKETREVDL